MVAEGVVDVLEAVEIHHHQRHRLLVALAQADRLEQPVVEQAPVRKAGQGVMEGLVLQFGLLSLPGGDVLDHPDQEQWLPTLASDQRGGGVAPHQGAVPAEGSDLELDAIFAAGRHLGEDAGIEVLRVDQSADRSAHQLPCLVTQHQPQGGVGFDEVAVETNPGDPDRGPVEHRVKALLTLLQGILRTPSLGHIDEAGDDLGRLAGGIQHRDRVSLQPAGLAVAPEDAHGEVANRLPTAEGHHGRPDILRAVLA